LLEQSLKVGNFRSQPLAMLRVRPFALALSPVLKKEPSKVVLDFRFLGTTPDLLDLCRELVMIGTRRELTLKRKPTAEQHCDKTAQHRQRSDVYEITLLFVRHLPSSYYGHALPQVQAAG
jgi:hypothetical protein